MLSAEAQPPEPPLTLTRPPGTARVAAAALAVSGAACAGASIIVPALSTASGADLSIWDARRLPGLMSVLWIVQAVVIVCAVTAVVLAMYGRLAAAAPLVAGAAGSAVVAVRLLTYPRDVGTPPLEPSIGIVLAAGGAALLTIAALVAVHAARRRPEPV